MIWGVQQLGLLYLTKPKYFTEVSDFISITYILKSIGGFPVNESTQLSYERLSSDFHVSISRGLCKLIQWWDLHWKYQEPEVATGCFLWKNSFLKLQVGTLLKKGLWRRWFSCEFCERSKNTFTEHLRWLLLLLYLILPI